MISNINTKSIIEIFAELNSSEMGLSFAESKKRLESDGLNKLPETKIDGYLSIFSRQFASPLIYVLLIAALIVFFMGEYTDAGAIIFVLFFNAVIGAFQEGKAQNTLEALKKFTLTEATVVREGKEIIIPSEDVVIGDIIIIKDGDKIPADARLISVNNLHINESALTGESEPVSKDTELISEESPVVEKKSSVFKGTYVITGNARAVVIATGSDTVVGKISTKLSTIKSEIPLQANLRSLSRVIVVGVIVINVFLFVIGLLQGKGFVEMFKIIVAVSVSLIPEGLPVVVTLVLATGVWRMSKKNALIKRLQAVEALGQANIIAVDKTGTITKNELMISEIYVGGRLYEVSGDGYSPIGEIYEDGQIVEPLSRTDLVYAGRIATFCANARAAYSEEAQIWKVSGDPTEAALLVFGQKIGFRKDVLEKENPQINEIPFSSNIKYHGTLHNTPEGNFYTKVGAPEAILPQVRFIWTTEGQREILPEDRVIIQEKIDSLTQKGLRVLAFAVNENSPDDISHEHSPELTFVGLFGMSDVIRQEAKEALVKAKEAGVKVVMITGDHQETARAIATDVGIYIEGDEIISGHDLETLSDEVLISKLDKVTVFARVSPEHKLRIIDAYQKRGDIVAMTGDGVNDALSLVSADLGVSMGKVGTEVAKEASDIILFDDNFGSIISAMEEGRNIYSTIKKVVLYLSSTSVAEVLVIIVAIILGWPLPLLAGQIIWLNLVTDSFLVAALALDPKEKNLLKEPFIKPNRWFFDKTMAIRAILMTVTMTIGTLVLFWFYLPKYIGPNIIDQVIMTKVWSVTLTVLVFYQWMNIWNCRSDRRSIFDMKAGENKYLLLAAGVVVLLQLGALYLPIFQTFLKTAPLNLLDWLLVIIVSLSILIVEELRKKITFYITKNNSKFTNYYPHNSVKLAN